MNISVERARSLRKNMPDAERAFWHQVRNRRFRGMKFRRQVPVGPYFADFLCHEKKIIVELDGGQHVKQADYDYRRTVFIGKMGFRVIRFWDTDVLKNMNGVLMELEHALGVDDPHPALSHPLPRTGEGCPPTLRLQ